MLNKFGLGRVASLANYDFCPWANRYFYWLKEPVGWFVLATLASMLVGAFVTPIGWTIAVGLLSVLALGLGFPYLATRCIRCRLQPVNDRIHEREVTQFELSVRNFLPIPVIGLRIDGYFSLPAGDELDHELINDSAIALARIPAFCTAVYRIPVAPEYRGRYPQQIPWMTCAFPFGIWTARRRLDNVSPITVLPLLIPISEELEVVGQRMAEIGVGRRTSNEGEFVGVREFRRGDALKNIHWAQSARMDKLIVCERGGPQQQAIEIRLSTTGCSGLSDECRENLAWRVRIAASLIATLSARHLPYRLYVDSDLITLPEGLASRNLAWDRLAELSLDGSPALSNTDAESISSTSMKMDRIQILPVDAAGRRLAARWVAVRFESQKLFHNNLAKTCRVIDLDDDIAVQLNHWLMEALRA